MQQYESCLIFIHIVYKNGICFFNTSNIILKLSYNFSVGQKKSNMKVSFDHQLGPEAHSALSKGQKKLK